MWVGDGCPVLHPWLIHFLVDGDDDVPTGICELGGVWGGFALGGGRMKLDPGLKKKWNKRQEG